MKIRPFQPNRVVTEFYRKDLTAFIHRAFIELNPGGTYHDFWYIQLLASQLEDIRHGRSRRFIINLPPRHLKSFVVSVAFVAWLLGHNPKMRILVVCYGQDLADKLARDCRTLMQSAFYKALFGTRLSRDRRAVAEFESTEGGYRMATSVGGVLTGRGADLIILDDPIKADEAQSEVRRAAVNQWFDNTLRSRLNSQETGAIVIVMQRLHADDLVAHVQRYERWNTLVLPAIAERDETYDFWTPLGRRVITRLAGTMLHPGLMSVSTLEALRQSVTEYIFVAQYQQNPQPFAGLVVLRAWLHFYRQSELPDEFDQVVQSWDTANTVTELANYSVCTTWSYKGGKLYLLDVFRRKMEFPELTRMVRELASLWGATIVLVEDKASGTQLIQQLRADGFSIIQAAPVGDGDKVMRLRAQTAKIEGGFVRFPEEASWLDGYLLELTAFPNAKYDDQVDSTVSALAWMTEERTKPGMGILRYYEQLAAQARQAHLGRSTLVRARVPGSSTHWDIPGRGLIRIPHPDRILEVTEEEAVSIIRAGGKKVV